MSSQLWPVPRSLSGPEILVSPAAYSTFLETQCGATDDSQNVEEYDGSLGPTKQFVEATQGQVCQFQWKSDLAQRYSKPGSVNGARWGTGTLIADNVVITCGHLFDQEPFGWQVPRVNGSNSRISPQEIATNMIVNFNYQYRPDGSLRDVESFDVVELIEYRLEGLDMAICRIAGSPGLTYGTSKLSTNDVAEGDLVAIIGHPAGFPKRIEGGQISSIDGHKIFYSDIDTLGGNSGSGILRTADMALIGIHTNGGCREDGSGSNSGFKVTSFIAASPFLQNLLR